MLAERGDPNVTIKPEGWRPVALAFLVLAGLVLRLRLAWQDIETIVVTTTKDDSYYYFQIARNLAHGNNVTFDGETVTNGFHPLWLALITPVYWVADGNDLPVHIILSIGALLGAATIVLVFAAIVMLTANHIAGLLGAMFFALHPQTVADSVNGVESAITVLMFMVVVCGFLLAMRRQLNSLRDDAVLGLACGLMILARTDTVFVAAPVLLLVALWSAPRDPVRRLAVMGSATLLTLLPWAIWSLIATGTLIQISGVASGWFAYESWVGAHGDSLGERVSHGFDVTRTTLLEDVWRRYVVPNRIPTGPVVVAALVAVCGAWFVRVRDGAIPMRRQVLLLGVVAVGVVASLVFHAGYRWQVREWYFATAGALVALFVGFGVSVLDAAIHRRAGNVRSRLPEPIVLARAMYMTAAALLIVQMRPWQPDNWVFHAEVEANHLEAARWIERNTPEDARIGSFNAGVIGYFSDRVVVNLDGVVNADAFEALRDCRVYQYVRHMRLSHVVDQVSASKLAYCGAEPGSEPFELVVTIGRPIFWTDRGLLDVLRVLD
jgi:hypothetical protein